LAVNVNVATFESPSLGSAGAGPGFELKFLLDAFHLQAAETWAMQRLQLDPHGDPHLGGAYRTTSLYFDTPELDVYHRTPLYKRRKYRLRRYGTAPDLFLECKAKRGDRVRKTRTRIAEADLGLLQHPSSLVDWPGHWFQRRLRERRLGPACWIAYQRTAYVGAGMDGPLRLTIDRNVHGIVTNTWSLGSCGPSVPLLTDHAILELKFRSALPAPFKDLVAALRLSPCAISKYRLCRAAWGVPALPREAAHA
jgi:hypothetical protein